MNLYAFWWPGVELLSTFESNIQKKERKYVNPIAKLGFEVYDRYVLYII